MCKKLILLISVLVLSLVSTSQALVVGDFEGGLDGWEQAGDATLSLATIGATSGTGSVLIEGPGSWQMLGKLEIKAIRSILGAEGAAVSADVTAFPEDMVTDWMNMEIIINGQNHDDTGANNNIGWQSLGGLDIVRDGVAQTLYWEVPADLSAKIAGTDDNIEWFELFIVTNNGGTNTKIYLDNIQMLGAEPEPVDMEIGFAMQPPVLDGQVDDIWAGASAQYFVPLDDPANGSGVWKALYDSENLYVLVDVTDDSLHNDSDGSWQDDSVELYFDGGNTKLNTPLAGDDHQYNFGWTTDEIQGTNIDGYTDGIEHAQVDTDTGWRIEIKLPWLSIWGVVPQAGDLIGIDCYYNDDDDGGDSRENKMLGFSAVEGWNDASQWGTAILAAIPEPAGPKVIFVSFHGADDAPSTAAADVGFTEASDKGYTDLLSANGYDVERYITSSSPDPNVLNAADLVIIGRAVSSGGYSNDGATAWNNISAPMIIMGGYVLRSSRMGYTTGTDMPDTTGDIMLTVTDPTHPIFAGIPLTDGTMDNLYAGGAVVLPTDGVTVSRGISINNNPADDEGTILATIAEASADMGPVGGMVIAEWPAGATLEHAGGAGADVLAGPRLVFLSGSREPDGVTGGDAAGLYDLYPDGEQMFLNAVDYMIPVKLVDPDTDGLVARYALDNDTADSSGNGLDGIIVGDPVFVDGIAGMALDFNGDDYVDCGNDAIFSITDGFTLSVWINWRATGATWQTVVAKGDNAWRLARGADTQTMDFGFTAGGDRGWQAARTASEVPLSEWHHVTVTYDTIDGAKIYLDGVLEGTNPDTGGITVGDYPVFIGENPQALNRFWDGLIDEVMIYNRVLSEGEILYLAGQ